MGPLWCLDTGLYGKNALQLLLKSIKLRYWQRKTRLVVKLRDSRDQLIKRSQRGMSTQVEGTGRGGSSHQQVSKQDGLRKSSGQLG